MEYQVFPNILCLHHCVPLYVCRLCINFQDLCARLLGMAALREGDLIRLLTFSSRFVIDFLSIRKVIIVSAIATNDRHPLRSRSIHQNINIQRCVCSLNMNIQQCVCSLNINIQQCVCSLNINIQQCVCSLNINIQQCVCSLNMNIQQCVCSLNINIQQCVCSLNINIQ